MSLKDEIAAYEARLKNDPKAAQQRAQTANTQTNNEEGQARLPYIAPQAGATLTKTKQEIEKEAFEFEQKKKGEPLTTEIDKKLSDLSASYQGFRRLSPKFKNDYGDTVVDWPTDLESDIQDRFPKFGTKGQSDWWKDMRTLEITARNAIFGASLQPNEQKAWAQTTISPGMSGEAIRANLQRREDIVREVLAREAAAARAGGYRPAQIEAKLGRYSGDFTPEATAKFYERLDKGLPPPGQRTEADDGKVPLLDAPPVGATLGGEGIKGWRLSQESEKAAAAVLRNGGSAEDYANFVGDRAVEEGKLKPEERDAFVAANAAGTTTYLEQFKGDPKALATIPDGLNYEDIDKKAQSEAGFGEKVAKSLSNVPTSAVQLAEGAIAPVVDAGLSVYKGEPTGTIKGIHALATDSDARGAALDALGERYLTKEGLANAAITDPLGLLGDASMVLTGGGSAAGRLPGFAGRVGQGLLKVGGAIDPITGTRKALDYAASGFKPHIADPLAAATGAVGREVIGITTGQPRGKTLSRAFAAGKEGGARGERFRKNMRSDADPNDLIAQADSALAQMQREASAQYRSGMVDVSRDKTVLDFTDIDQTLTDLEKRAFYKGEVRDAAAAKAWTDTKALVDDWKSKDPAEFHTPEGMDVLKQKVGDLGSSYQMGNDRNAAAIATQLYGAVKKAVADQVPTYAKTMEEYAQKADQLREIRTTFSLNPKASVDTKLRKLFSSGRNTVNANFGQREKLTEMMDRYTGGKLIDDISAQNLSSVLPRGIGGPLASAVGGSGVAGGAAALFAPQFVSSVLNPANLLTLPLASPRLMGEAAHFAGRASRKIGEGIDLGLAGVRKPLQPMLDLQKKYPGIALAETRGVAGLEGVADERERSSRPPIAIDEPEIDLSDLTDEEKAMLLEERRKRIGMAYGGAVRRLSQRYACGGPVRRG